jgi:very-short-patch-repair endonuclease
MAACFVPLPLAGEVAPRRVRAAVGARVAMELRRNTGKARQLRDASTDAERALWTQLRARRMRHCKFRRQYPISGYIVDFVCLQALLIIELDGGQHVEQMAYDNLRSAVLAKSGYRVLRFWNNEVLTNLPAVLEEIHKQIGAPPSPQPLSRQRERG